MVDGAINKEPNKTFMTKFEDNKMPSTDYQVPSGLTEMLQEFTVAVLRNQPPNLNTFARDYFERKCLGDMADQDYHNNNGYSDEESGT